MRKEKKNRGQTITQVKGGIAKKEETTHLKAGKKKQCTSEAYGHIKIFTPDSDLDGIVDVGIVFGLAGDRTGFVTTGIPQEIIAPAGLVDIQIYGELITHSIGDADSVRHRHVEQDRFRAPDYIMDVIPRECKIDQSGLKVIVMGQARFKGRFKDRA